MAYLPNSQWEDRTSGAIRYEQWKALVTRMPYEWHNNPHALPIPEGQFGLDIIPLETYLERFPGKPCISPHHLQS